MLVFEGVLHRLDANDASQAHIASALSHRTIAGLRAGAAGHL